MNNFFNIDNKFFKSIDRVADIFWLNILWLICCIPIITIGASTTALFYVTLKMSRNEESYITRNFFHSFKQNFIQATVAWLIALVTGIVLYIDIRAISAQEGILYQIFTVVLYVMTIVYGFIMLYIFPYMAKFENTILNTIKNSLLLAAIQLPYTVLIVIMIAIPVGIMVVLPYLTVILILFGGSGIALSTSYVYSKIFDKLIKTDEDNDNSEN